MSGTVIGGRKASITVRARKGNDFYRRIGSIGGRASHSKPRGFAAVSRAQRQAAGAKGGRISRRRSKSYNEGVLCNEDNKQHLSHQDSRSSESTSKQPLGRCGHCGHAKTIVRDGLCQGCIDYWEARGVDTTKPGWRPF